MSALEAIGKFEMFTQEQITAIKSLLNIRDELKVLLKASPEDIEGVMVYAKYRESYDEVYKALIVLNELSEILAR